MLTKMNNQSVFIYLISVLQISKSIVVTSTGTSAEFNSINRQSFLAYKVLKGIFIKKLPCTDSDWRFTPFAFGFSQKVTILRCQRDKRMRWHLGQLWLLLVDITIPLVRADDLWSLQEVTDNQRNYPDNWRNYPDNWRNYLDNWRNYLDNWRNYPDNWKNYLDNWRKYPDNWINYLNNWRNYPDSWRNYLDNWRNYLQHCINSDQSSTINPLRPVDTIQVYP